MWPQKMPKSAANPSSIPNETMTVLHGEPQSPASGGISSLNRAPSQLGRMPRAHNFQKTLRRRNDPDTEHLTRAWRAPGLRLHAAPPAPPPLGRASRTRPVRRMRQEGGGRQGSASGPRAPGCVARAVGRWVLERKGLMGVRAVHPLSSAPSLISVSITHLSNRLFLELDFIIRARQSFRLLRPKHTPLPPAPKCVSVNRRRSDRYKVPPLCTSAPGKHSQEGT